MKHAMDEYYRERREARQRLADLIEAAAPDARTYTADYMDLLGDLNRAHPCAIAYTVREDGTVDDPRRLSDVYAVLCRLLYEWGNCHPRGTRLWRFARVVEFPPRLARGGRLHVVLLVPRADMYHMQRVVWLE